MGYCSILELCERLQISEHTYYNLQKPAYGVSKRLWFLLEEAEKKAGTGLAGIAIRATLAESPAEYSAGPALPAGQWPRRLAEYLDARRGIIDGLMANGEPWKNAVLLLIISWVDEEKKTKEPKKPEMKS